MRVFLLFLMTFTLVSCSEDNETINFDEWRSVQVLDFDDEPTIAAVDCRKLDDYAINKHTYFSVHIPEEQAFKLDSNRHMVRIRGAVFNLSFHSQSPNSRESRTGDGILTTAVLRIFNFDNGDTKVYQLIARKPAVRDFSSLPQTHNLYPYFRDIINGDIILEFTLENGVVQNTSPRVLPGVSINDSLECR